MQLGNIGASPDRGGALSRAVLGASSPSRISKPPTSLSNHASPTHEEIPLWTHGQLHQLPKQSLQTRARDLKLTLEKIPNIPPEFIKSCRTCGEAESVILWILQGQCLLMQGVGKPYTIQDFGAAQPAEEVPQTVFTGALPSIKKTKETIEASGLLKAGPNMHDSQ